MLSNKKKVYNILDSFCNTTTTYSLPKDIFDVIWNIKYDLENMNESIENELIDTINTEDVSMCYRQRGSFKYKTNGKKYQKIKKAFKFQYNSRPVNNNHNNTIITILCSC